MPPSIMLISAFPETLRPDSIEYSDISYFIEDFYTDQAKQIDAPHSSLSRGNIFISRSGLIVFKVYILSKRRVLDRIRARWKLTDHKFGQRFGWSEWLNACKAKDLGVPIANPVAYLESSNFLSCSLQVIALERLTEHKTLLDLLTNNINQNLLLCTIESLIFSAAKCGIFHVDLNCRNILISQFNLLDTRLIDWEYACFHRRKLGSLYGHYLGYLFFDSLRDLIPEKDFDDWAHHKILKRSLELKQEAHTILDSYEAAKVNTFSRQERYRLFI